MENKANGILDGAKWFGPTVVSEIRGKRTMAEPGVWAYDAEAVVSGNGEDTVYVHVNEYDMFKHYTVSKSSFFDSIESGTKMSDEECAAFDEEIAKIFTDGIENVDLDGGEDAAVDFIEEYSKLADAKQSKYYKVFDTLNKVITRMAKGLE